METEKEPFDFRPLKSVVVKDESRDILKLQREFLESYIVSRDKMPMEVWFEQEMHKQLPHREIKEIQKMSAGIINSLRKTEEMKESQQKALSQGRSKESWLASILLQSTSHMSTEEKAKYLESLDAALKSANQAMGDTLRKKSISSPEGRISPNLNDFISEQPEANSFNIMGPVEDGSSVPEDIRHILQNGEYNKEPILSLDLLDDFSIKNMASEIGKEVGDTSLKGTVINTATTLVTQVCNGEPIDGDDIIKNAIRSGEDFFVKTATAGALEVASENGLLEDIPILEDIAKGEQGNIPANIAFAGVENLKTLNKVATGELSAMEGIEVMTETAGACLGSIIETTEASELGTAIGSVFGPAGAVLGGVICATISTVVGSTFGKGIVTAAKTVFSVGAKLVSGAAGVIGSVASGVVGAIGSVIGGICDFFFDW